MVSRVENILLNVRDILSDHKKTRWSDDTLLRTLTLGINDLISRTKVTKSSLYIDIEENIGIYKIQDYSQSILDVKYIDKSLIVKTTAEMNAIDKTWESTATSTYPIYVIFDNLPQGTFRIYPKVTDTSTAITLSNSLYGAIIDINATDELYKLPNIENLESLSTKYLKVTYVKKHPKLSLQSELDFDDIYDEAMIYFVSGMSLRNDADTQNRAFGTEQLKFYDSMVSVAKGNETISNNSLAPIATSYKGFM